MTEPPDPAPSPMLAIQSGIALVLAAGAIVGTVAAVLAARGDASDPRTVPIMACVAGALVLFGLMLLLTERIMSAQVKRAVRDGPLRAAPEPLAPRPHRPSLAGRAIFARLGPAALLLVLGYLAMRRYG